MLTSNSTAGRSAISEMISLGVAASDSSLSSGAAASALIVPPTDLAPISAVSSSLEANSCGSDSGSTDSSGVITRSNSRRFDGRANVATPSTTISDRCATKLASHGAHPPAWDATASVWVAQLQAQVEARFEELREPETCALGLSTRGWHALVRVGMLPDERPTRPNVFHRQF